MVMLNYIRRSSKNREFLWSLVKNGFFYNSSPTCKILPFMVRFSFFAAALKHVETWGKHAVLR